MKFIRRRLARSALPVRCERQPDVDLRYEMTEGLVRTVSHELRTPLCTIRGNAELLLGDSVGGGLTGHQRRLVESLERNGRRLEAVVDGLGMLFDAHACTGRATTELRVADVVHAARADQQQLLTDRRATVRLTGALQDLVVHGSRAQLQLALSQLISNAVRFSPDPVRVDVAVQRVGPDATIRVTDHGVGISGHELGSVFDWFFRGSASHTVGTPGVGLGLTIAKAVVEAHGGTISLTSEERRGTSVTIALPLDRVPAERPAAVP